MNKYVYILFDHQGIPFYVGCGTGNRWEDHKKETGNQRKQEVAFKTIQILGEIPKVKIAENLTNEQGYEIEKLFIQAIGKHPNGPLTNLTAGGLGLLGHTFSNEHRKKISINSTIRMSLLTQEQKSELARRRGARSCYNWWINDGTNQKRVKPGSQIPNGWRRGRLIKVGPEFNKSTKGTVWITNGESSKRLRDSEPIPDGWSIGRIVNWSKINPLYRK